MKFPEVWDIDSIFKGGSKSEEFKQFTEETDALLKTLDQELEKEFTIDQLETYIVDIQAYMQRTREASAFISCLTAQDVKDKEASLWLGKITEQMTQVQSIWGVLEDILVALTDEQWQEVIDRPSLSGVSFNLEERRQQAQEKLSSAEEKLAGQLAIDGYHAWGNVYNSAVGRMQIPFEEDGEEKLLSAGQLQNRLNSGDRSVREQAFAANETAWGKEADLFSQTLNHLAGFRLNLYKARGWDNVLKEPLTINRMKEETLDAMWQTITDNKPRFYEFMDRKAQLLGVEKLAMHDVHAPLPVEGDTTISYEDACELIIKHFKTFSPKLASFTEGALRDGWIEAEDRAGKRPGGFCTSFPLSKQSRIFMTYDGTMANVATLAHELGHAYHGHCLKDMDPLAQRYAMNVAETASTFAETIIADALVKEAPSEDVKLSLLENKISRSLAFFMNIHARFLFETRFYEARKNKMLSVKELNTLMEEAQKEAYGDQLTSYSPTFWASKLHFHITGVPFYNFPYTFGFLFSLGIYKKALEAGRSFEDDYIALLQDTASMTVEDLAQKHLQIDLTNKDFWQEAIDLILVDVEEFMELTNK
ncbi:M3 family oligoendopeptidase [Halalkalibacter akibai]|uniref:Oligoendopeptidase F n=1 Tax=Halalkalibacter akibai (strain ATCC 43226 / DSM 21942 / CIP 109018 / JCM 9157 / 1139) TaxID=1236973 RepID=W4QWH7_HALA3|nr:M3 family oligoendopeptidase [Halalkalibacter akibai]GAE36431.1 oligoendopeptidase F [Halalkalibacter akibai JCM 9157]